MFDGLTISKRLYLGFGIIIIGMIAAFWATFQTISNSKRLNDEINNEINPSLANLNVLSTTLKNIEAYTLGWFNAVGPNDNKRNHQLEIILYRSYPKLKLELSVYPEYWDSKQRQALNGVLNNTDSLVRLSKTIVNAFKSIEDYDDDLKKLSFTTWFDDNGEMGSIHKVAMLKLNTLIDLTREVASRKSNEMKSAFNNLVRLIAIVGIVLIIGGILIAFFTVKAIVDPVDKLKVLINTLSLGQIPKQGMPMRQDEIGEMSLALDNLIDGFERKTAFANEIGQGHFETDFQPLSKADTLGLALLEMRDEIRDGRRSLEVKVQERTLALNQQKERIENLYQQVTSSIRYAKRIQESIMPSAEKVQALLPNSFILYQPKDIVSGDFYWIESRNNKVYIAAVDCTGHGVPGAFMSLLGRNLLNLIVNNSDIQSPAEILDALNQGILDALQSNDAHAKDGMDIAICCLDKSTQTLEFAGAVNELYLIRNNDLQVIMGDKHYLGMQFNHLKGFKNHTLKLEANDCFYIFTDGFRDQFGDLGHKKFMRKRFNQMLQNHHALDMREQGEVYQNTLKEWMGNCEQTDDILLLGWKV